MTASTERIREVVERYVALVGSGTADEIVALYTDGATVEDPVGSDVLTGVEAIRGFYATLEGLEQETRLLTLRAAYLMDTVGNKAAKSEIAQIKVVAPRMALRVLDRAIQAHGGAGVSDDFPLAKAWAHARTLRLADGPDEVHLESIAKIELAK